MSNLGGKQFRDIGEIRKFFEKLMMNRVKKLQADKLILQQEFTDDMTRLAVEMQNAIDEFDKETDSLPDIKKRE